MATTTKTMANINKTMDPQKMAKTMQVISARVSDVQAVHEYFYPDLSCMPQVDGWQKIFFWVLVQCLTTRLSHESPKGRNLKFSQQKEHKNIKKTRKGSRDAIDLPPKMEAKNWQKMPFFKNIEKKQLFQKKNKIFGFKISEFFEILTQLYIFNLKNVFKLAIRARKYEV